MSLSVTKSAVKLDGKSKAYGGYITSADINVNIIGASTASVTVVSEDGEYDEVEMYASFAGGSPKELAFTYTQEGEGGEDEEVKALTLDFWPIGSEIQQGAGGTVLTVSLLEAVPSWIAKVPVFLRGVHTDASGSERAYTNTHSAWIVVGEEYMSSPSQNGALIKLSGLTSAQKSALEKKSLLSRLKNSIQKTSLYTGYELYQEILALRIPHTLAFAHMVSTVGYYYNTGGSLRDVLNVISQKLGCLFFWNPWAPDGQEEFADFTMGGLGNYGLDVFEGEADIWRGMQTAQGEANLISKTLSTTLEGTYTKSATKKLEVAPDHPSNMCRGQGTAIRLNTAQELKLKDCANRDVDDLNYPRRDTDPGKGDFPKEPDPEQMEKIAHLCRLLDAARFGEDFFRIYVYLKMVAQQFAERKDNIGYASAYTWVAGQEPKLSRNLAVEALFPCIIAASPNRVEDGTVQDYENNEVKQPVEKPWSHSPAIAELQTLLINEGIGVGMAAEQNVIPFMIAYINNDPNAVETGKKNGVALLKDFGSSEVWKSLLTYAKDIQTNIWWLQGDVDVVGCDPETGGGKKTGTDTNYFTGSWKEGCEVNFRSSITKLNPWLELKRDDILYKLLQLKVGPDKMVEFFKLNIKLTAGMAIAVLSGEAADQAEKLGSNKDWVDFVKNLECAEKLKTISQAQRDKDKDWACKTDALEMLPDGELLISTEGGRTLKAGAGKAFQEDWTEKYKKVYFTSLNKQEHHWVKRAKRDGFDVVTLPYLTNQGNPLPENMFEFPFIDNAGKLQSNFAPYLADEIDQMLDTLPDKTTPWSLAFRGGAKQDPPFTFSCPGDRKKFFAAWIYGAENDVLSNTIEGDSTLTLADVLLAEDTFDNDLIIGEKRAPNARLEVVGCDGATAKGETPNADLWIQKIPSRRTDVSRLGIEKEQDKDPANTLQYACGLANKEGIIQENMNMLLNDSALSDFNQNEGGTFVYNGVPTKLPTIWEGLENIGATIDSQGGLTLTLSVGQRKIRGARDKINKLITFRDFLATQGYDSTSEFFGPKFKSSVESKPAPFSFGLKKPNQAAPPGQPQAPVPPAPGPSPQMGSFDFPDVGPIDIGTD